MMSDSPRCATLVDGNGGRALSDTSGVTDGDGDRGAGSDVNGPGEGGAGLLVKALEGVSCATALGDSGEVRSCTSGPGELNWLAGDQGGWGGDSESLCPGEAGGSNSREGDGGGREVHCDYRRSTAED